MPVWWLSLKANYKHRLTIVTRIDQQKNDVVTRMNIDTEMYKHLTQASIGFRKGCIIDKT